MKNGDGNDSFYLFTYIRDGRFLFVLEVSERIPARFVFITTTIFFFHDGDSLAVGLGHFKSR
jgi:hypothetical protein